MEWFRGRRVALWGCGTVGRAVADHLDGAGVAKLTVRSYGLGRTGVAERKDSPGATADPTMAPQRRPMMEAPNAKVAWIDEDLLETLNRDDWDADVDVVIDATASPNVRARLEKVLKGRSRNVPIASVMIDDDAQLALAVVSPPQYGSGPMDVLRRLGLAAAERESLGPWARAFWGRHADAHFREHGCSNPTFVASHTDVASLAVRAVNVIAEALSRSGQEAVGAFVTQSFGMREHCIQFKPDIRWLRDGVEFRLANNAWRDMLGWIRREARRRSAENEVGGLLFGEFDEEIGVAWMSNVSGPPNDSSFSPDLFVCGTEGIGDLCEGYATRTDGVVRYIGTWHFHPNGLAAPSPTDYAGIGSVFPTIPYDGLYQIMAIVGNSGVPEQEIGAYVFERRNFVKGSTSFGPNGKVRGGRMLAPQIGRLGKKIGLSLSGGGSRAVAFHLGTLRALEDLHILEEVQVISGVSGGSVMAGLLGYTQADFAEVDQRTTRFLGSGLAKSTFWKMLHPRRFTCMLSGFLAVALPTMAAELTVVLARWVGWTVPGGYVVKEAIRSFRWPLRQRYSRTHAMADAIADVVGNQMCNAATRQGKSIVFNACELRTGTAFRMSNERFGSWRFGYAHANSLRVAEAVAASAAYPALLPPFDWELEFEKDGRTAKRRVVVTDGGVFENLGVSVMEPGRNADISGIGYEPDIIIASDAGFGQMNGEAVPLTWWSRMMQVGASVMRKVEDATKRRLHEHLSMGRIAAFVYVGLGQADERVHPKTGGWMNREAAIDFPTDFNAMPKDQIDGLAGRGEGIARALMTRYILSD